MSDDAVRGEVILVTHPTEPARTGPLDAIKGVLSNTAGMAGYTAATLASMIEQTVGAAVESSVNAALDRVVPAIADAIIERLDLNRIVLDQVDLNLIVNTALDSLDLTQLVIDRVDVNAIVAQADIDAVIDRVPIIPLANYVIDEIDLPQIIRDSTSGIAGDAMNATRRQSVGADQMVSRIADRIIFRRKSRDVDAPGDPHSLAGMIAEELGEPTPPVGEGEKLR
jgi:uncharacterized membrane protein YheB (UPF0754 family)